MCGFALAIGRQGWTPSEELLRLMGDAIKHRGPDDSGLFLEGRLGAAFRRLAILDLSVAGHQPMLSRDGRHVMVFNGEIFNFLELRAELGTLGHEFHSSGDTEVLLAAWRQWGLECLPRLNGMFAFAVLDRSSGEVVGARDRSGIKPLYVFQSDRAFLLGSEIKAIVASGMYKHRTNEDVMSRFLVHGHLDDTRDTFFDGIRTIAAGSWFRIAPDGEWSERLWWEVPFRELDNVSDAPTKYREAFDEAIELQLRSDVPVGVTLSGGLDSTSVICTMARLLDRRGARAAPLNAFAYMDDEFDESTYVNETVEAAKAKLIPLRFTAVEVWQRLERVMHSQDEPVHSMAAVVGHGLMELAREHSTPVILNGQGADETLAGYPSYFSSHWLTLLYEGNRAYAWEEIEKYAVAVGADARQLKRQVLKRFALVYLGRLPGYRALTRTIGRAQSRSPWFSGEVARRAYVERDGSFDLRSSLRSSVAVRPLPLYLRMEDRNSMAHSIEARVPFLDWRLIRLASELPARWKLRGAATKYVLREAMRGRIPESVRLRVDKMGFPTPGERWFGKELYEPLLDVLTSRAARERGLYRSNQLIAYLDRSRGQRVAFWGPLFRIVQVEHWFKMLNDRGVA